ncbi:MAG: bifunctional glutamate N-acetyltransferase/amino-acid acetyltransferase ArgJ, partial [Pseudomonadota bacterium]
PERFPELPAVGGVRTATGRLGLYEGNAQTRDDAFLLVFDEGTVASGVFTSSTTASDDVARCRAHLSGGKGAARALLVNAGNSNAFTGAAGKEKNAASLAALQQALKCERETCFLAATGVIGEPMEPPNRLAGAVPDMAVRLTAPDWQACARAFMTTDTYPKGAGCRMDVGGYSVAFAGIAKGSGMIAPNMATMLAYIATDAHIAPGLLQSLTEQVAGATFNSITVDGDTSTSDSFQVFATGQSGMEVVAAASDPRANLVREGLTRVALQLAHQIVKDGEGAQKFIAVRATGAASDSDARSVAGAIATSPLVKTALAASDANWGRIVMAVGKSGITVEAAAFTIWIGEHLVAEGGARAPDYNEAAAMAACAGREIEITVSIGAGPGEAVVYTCDLTHAYIDINGAYRT